jgi:hypothetical protein
VVELSWPPVADRILGFNVYRSTGGAERHEAPLNGDTPQVRTGFVDRQASPDSGYTYWLEVVYAPGESYLAEGVDVGAGAGTAHVVALGRAEPNPFEKRTTISLHVEEALEVDVSIYATGGRVVRSLMSGTQLPGTSRLEWDGTDEGGRRVPPGLYFCRAWWPGGTTSVKVLLLKGKTP